MNAIPNIRMKGKIFLFLCSLIIATALAEGYLRLTEQRQHRGVSLYEQGTAGLTVHRKNLDARIFDPESESSVHILTNADGFMGGNYPHQKDSKVTRIAVIGDSFIEGRQVDSDAIATALLEKKLNERSGGIRYEVLNFGVGNINTMDEERYYEHYVRAYRPDIILLAFFVGNDLTNKPGARADTSPIIDCAKKYFACAFRFLENRSRLISFFANAVRNSSTLHAILVKIGIANDVPPEQDQTIQLLYPFLDEHTSNAQEIEATGEVVTRLANRTREDGSRLAVVFIPSSWQVDAMLWDRLAARNSSLEPDLPQKSLMRVFPHDLPILDLSPIFATVINERHEEIYIRGMGHFTKRGHEVVADTLYSFTASQMTSTIRQ